MIKRFRAIVSSIDAPKDKEVIWLNKNTLYFYRDGDWSPVEELADPSKITVTYNEEEVSLPECIELISLELLNNAGAIEELQTNINEEISASLEDIEETVRGLSDSLTDKITNDIEEVKAEVLTVSDNLDTLSTTVNTTIEKEITPIKESINSLVVNEILNNSKVAVASKVFFDSIDETNNLLKLKKGNQTLYATLFKGLIKPTVNAPSGTETTSATATINITNNESEALIYYRKSSSKLTISNVTTEDLTTTWTKGTSVSVDNLLSDTNVKWYIYAVATKNGLISEIDSGVASYLRKLLPPKISADPDNAYASSRTIKIDKGDNTVNPNFKYGESSNAITTEYKTPFSLTNNAKTLKTYYATANLTGWQTSNAVSLTVTVSTPYYYYTSLTKALTSVPTDVSTWKKLTGTFNGATIEFTKPLGATSFIPAILIPTNNTTLKVTATVGGAPCDMKDPISGKYPSSDGNSYNLYMTNSELKSDTNIKFTY